MRILVLGKNGQLGLSLKKAVEDFGLGCEFIFAGRNEIDLSKRESIYSYFNAYHFDLIINCAAYTAVDNAEKERKSANLINNKAVEFLAEISNLYNSVLIHISTDYVFDGKITNSYIETDETNPINVYGKTKLLGENKIKKLMPKNAIIIRTSWLYSHYGKNFVDTIIRNALINKKLDVINNQFGSPTYAQDLSETILKIIESLVNGREVKHTQIYHFSNDGSPSWFDFANEIIRLAKIECIINPIDSNQYPSIAKRPKNTSLHVEKISKEFNVDVKHWKTSLINYMDLMNTR
tara:strand:- start:411 stop:1289 length:879 start_codon:yes stop_codon:yes gene_type:complete